MWFLTAGLPGALQTVDDNVDTLLTRASEVRLARLDADVSSRAPSSTALSSSVWGSTEAGYLDAPISGAGGKVPVSLERRTTSNGSLIRMDPLGTLMSSYGIGCTCDTYNVWEDLINVTSTAGVITFAAVWQSLNASARNAQLSMLIDGTEVYLSNSALFTDSGDDDKGLHLVGICVSSASNSQIGLENIPFTDSFQIRAKKTENSAGDVYLTGKCLYRVH